MFLFSVGTALFAYLIGSVPFGYLVGRWRGIDVLAAGSGNIGATNVGRLLGRTFGILVFALDLLKGALPVLLAEVTAPSLDGPAPEIAGVIAGVAAFLGHLFPVFLRFRGGKGVATGAGVILVLMPLTTLVALIFWLTIAGTSRYVSVASILAALLLCVLRMVQPQTWDGPGMIVTLFCLTATAFVVVGHYRNLVRLVAGTENKLSESLALNITRIVHLFAVGTWFGSIVFFTLTGVLLFRTFDELSASQYRPKWFPTAEIYEQDRPSDKFPEPLRREQGARLFGAAVTPIFPWYYILQVGCAFFAQMTLLAWNKNVFVPQGVRFLRGVHFLRALVLGLAFVMVGIGQMLAIEVGQLRQPRNELTDKMLTSPDRAAELPAAEAAQARFGMWHGFSLLLNFTTLVLVGIGLACAAWMPAQVTKASKSEEPPDAVAANGADQRGEQTTGISSVSPVAPAR